MRWRVGLAALIAIILSGTAEAQTYPSAGVYDASVYVAATGVQGAGNCADSPGDTAEARKLKYTGPTGTLFKYWSTTGSSTPSIFKEVFTIGQTTTSGDSTDISGTFTAESFPAGTPFNGFYSAQINYFDANSFTMQIQEQYVTQEGGTCTETIEMALARSGE
jgi:hypothetical protein